MAGENFITKMRHALGAASRVEIGLLTQPVALHRYPDCMAFQRIVVDHRVMAGVPCIRGTRIPVATVVGLVAEGMTTGEILADFPQFAADDVREALQFAAAAVDQATVPLPASA